MVLPNVIPYSLPINTANLRINAWSIDLHLVLSNVQVYLSKELNLKTFSKYISIFI